MRYDLRTDGFRLTRDIDALRTLARAEHLAYARFETALAQKFFAILDLVFADGDRVALLPWVIVDGTMILERELSPFIWPAFLAQLDDGRVESIERRLEPWLRSRAIARNENHHGERLFSNDDDFRTLLQRARERGWSCAAPSADVLLDVAPHVYASRFASAGSIAVCGRGAVNGAAYLSVDRDDVYVRASSEEEARDARRWFGLRNVGVAAPEGCELYVGARENDPGCRTAVLLDTDARDGEARIAVARPLPIEVLVSFDLDDAGEASSFAVRCEKRPARASHVSMPAATGGSAGRIALVVREDAMRVRDADTDAVSALQSMLNAEGFAAEIVTPSHFRAERYDVIHVFGYRYAATIVGQIAVARERSIPVVVSPYLDDPQNEFPIGTSTFRRLLQTCDDEILRGEYLRALALRRLRDDDIVDGLDPAALQTLISTARVAFVTCGREEERLRSAFGFGGQGIYVPAIASNTNGADDATWATGYDDFALVTGGIGTESNAYLVARAAGRLRIPLIVCGDVVDAAYYPELRAVLGRTGRWLPAASLTEAQRRSLLARARVVVDASWSGTGLHRLATAASTGAAIVGSAAGYAGDVWGELVFTADPASEESIAVALGRAWIADDGHRRALIAKTAPIADPLSVLVNTVQGYHHAAAVTAS